MLRTTTALTIVNAGNKENVLPGRAEATVNFRLLPGDSVASGDRAREEHRWREPGIEARTVLPGAAEPSKVAPTDSASVQADRAHRARAVPRHASSRRA